MIYQNRDEVSISREAIDLLKKEKARAKQFFDRKDRTQERFEFNSQAWKKTKQSLVELFDNTCAYCESSASSSSLDIEHFRPKSGACDFDGVTDPDWYWWLAYEWNNLYLVCNLCNFSKKILFPVIGKRVSIGTTGKELLKEKNVLLDPCEDQPAHHLRFLEDGMVQSISTYDLVSRRNYKNFDRGAVTIDILGLNRPELTNSRKKTALNILRIFHLIEQHITSAKESNKKRNSSLLPVVVLLNELISATYQFGEYVALKRQIIARRLVEDRKFRQYLFEAESEKLLELEENITVEIKIEKSFLRKKLPKLAIKTTSTQAEMVIPQVKIEIKYDNAYIKKVEIRNFRTINELTINFNEWEERENELTSPSFESTESSLDISDSDTEKRVGWKMLLGENGTGKSSFLKALALALMGKEYYLKYGEKYLLTPARIFNKKTRQKEGFIRVELSKGDPIHINFTKTDLKFVSGAAGASGVFIRGYGAARLFSRHHDVTEDNDAAALKKVDNIFHPEHFLEDPNKWLNVLQGRQLDSVALVLRDLLNLPAGLKKPLTRKTVKHKREVFLDSGFGALPIVDQSDGYNSILALMADILMGLPNTMHDKKQATGIVLLDEIDAHLHPRWKMQIVGSLRRCFPNIQFIATTHEPLCLRGLCAGEITVMKRIGDKIVVKNDVPSPTGLRVDQLLTSELFGLDSTIDPAVDLQFQEYYQLLAINAPTAVQTERLNQLKETVKPYNILGTTRRDQLVYESIDKYIAEDRSSPAEAERLGLREETKNTILDLWSEITIETNDGGDGK